MSLTKSRSKIRPQLAVGRVLLAVLVFKEIALSRGPGVGRSEMNFNYVLLPFHDSAKNFRSIVEFLCGVFHDIQLFPFWKAVSHRSLFSILISR